DSYSMTLCLRCSTDPSFLSRMLTSFPSTSLLLSLGPHPVLHPFPPRRPSDLWGPNPFQSGIDPAYMKRVEERIVEAVRLADRLRSEEHTSELQTRVELVCRLLLEKKKNNSNTWSSHASISLKKK